MTLLSLRTATSVTHIDPRFVIIVGMIASLPAVSTDIYLPSLPDVVIDLNTTKAAAQLSLTGVPVGGGLGQPLIGPLRSEEHTSELQSRGQPVCRRPPGKNGCARRWGSTARW